MQHQTERSIGISIGAASIKVAVIESQGGVARVLSTEVLVHSGDPRRVLRDLAARLEHGCFDFGLLTGRKLRHAVRCASVAEPEALEAGLRLLCASTRPTALASLGAESFVVYRLSDDLHIDSVETGSKCASGTGEFFLQQVGRMNVGVDEALELAAGVEPYRVSGRCTVFCKSDCTHALNKGVPVGRVAAGLSQMTADKVVELLDGMERGRVAVVGGMTRNRVVIDLLRQQVEHLLVPDHADAFEAVGAAALALEQRQPWRMDHRQLFGPQHSTFDFLPPLAAAEPLVRFESAHRGSAVAGDECIVGLDVGSTTTKAVVLRRRDNAVLASIYLRTHGNPVEASRQCYASLASQLEAPVKIVAVATTGSGRQIAGLHAGTEGVINEIIAHATGAAYYDSSVDTIFEIGGQDAKYTHLVAGVPADYAMNEACSAGTGSFLEEAARESMGLDYREIAQVAVAAIRPPNFNDQCAAFISSDIKTAIHEGVGHADAVAGLVYSICMNYLNRVKGARAVGDKIFMQGGVCYNRAVPLAMASLLRKPIIVPPDPGLVGAFGVALEAKYRLERGTLSESLFDLRELASRAVVQGKTFRCRGGKENCDRGCEIATMLIDGRKYPFGGACNKYYNELHRVQHDATEHDYVRRRQELVFETHAAPKPHRPRARIGVLRTFLTHRYYPLYSHFFARLGLEPVLSEKVDVAGMRRSAAEMCFPAEIAHGALADLLGRDLDFLFLPKLFSLPVEGGTTDRKFQASCLLLQSEAYWLRSAFAGELAGKRIVEPQFDFNEGLRARRGQFAALAEELGASWLEGSRAFAHAVQVQESCERDIKELCREAMAELGRHTDRRAVVLFGRPYNAFAKEANLAIPDKFASRGVTVIPWDALPYEDEPVDPDINWAIGQNLLRAAKVVARHPQLFGAWITNFSCGPDSFLVGYFRDIMGHKPSLTLELDSHSADAGVNTRIEAFLDIVDKYRRLGPQPVVESTFVPARIILREKKAFYESSGRALLPLTDPRVHLVFPSMGPLGTEILAGVFRGIGVRATALPVPDHEVLRLGRGHTSCKECLPLQLVTGALLKYLKYRSNADEYLAFFMPTSAGGCRLTQYSVSLRRLMARLEQPNVAFLSLTNTNGYAGLEVRDQLSVLKAVIVSDVMEDIRSAISVLSRDRQAGLATFDEQWQRVMRCFVHGQGSGLYDLLESVARNLRSIELRAALSEARRVALHGEMYVRRDHFSSGDIVERLATRDIVALRAHVFEYLYYSDYNVDKNLWENKVDPMGFGGRVQHKIKMGFERAYETTIKRILGRSGLYVPELLNVPHIVEYAKNFMDPRFTGEALLTTGSFFKDILHGFHGIISVGPFACMHARVAEALVTPNANTACKADLDKKVLGIGRVTAPEGFHSLPFLAIEADGNPFPQVVDAKLDVFALQVERLHRQMK